MFSYTVKKGAVTSKQRTKRKPVIQWVYRSTWRTVNLMVQTEEHQGLFFTSTEGAWLCHQCPPRVLQSTQWFSEECTLYPLTDPTSVSTGDCIGIWRAASWLILHHGSVCVKRSSGYLQQKETIVQPTNTAHCWKIRGEWVRCDMLMDGCVEERALDMVIWPGDFRFFWSEQEQCGPSVPLYSCILDALWSDNCPSDPEFEGPEGRCGNVARRPMFHWVVFSGPSLCGKGCCVCRKKKCDRLHGAHWSVYIGGCL